MLLSLSTGLFKYVESHRLACLMPLLHAAGFRRLEVVDRAEFATDGVMLDGLRTAAKEHGIQIPSWHLIQESPFQKDVASGKAAVERMKASMERGARVGVPNHVLHWYHRFLDRRYDNLWRDTVDEWAEYARGLGIRLLMETVPDKPSNERYVPASEIMAFVRRYPPEIMSICVDVNHSNLKEDLPDVIRCVQDRLVSLHVSDNDGHAEQHWLPGQGVINFPRLFDSLEDVGFEGLLVMEVNPWCKAPQQPSSLLRLNKFVTHLMETHQPHPDVPPLV